MHGDTDVIAGRFVVDAGDPGYSAALSQSEVDGNGHGLIYFRVGEHTHDPAENHVLSFDLLDWIEPEITADHHLVLLTLFSTSWHIGRGRIRSYLHRVRPFEQAKDPAAGERWRMTVDPSSVDGPPVLHEDDLTDGPTRSEVSRRGIIQVEVDYGTDDRVLGFELTISPPQGPLRDA